MMGDRGRGGRGRGAGGRAGEGTWPPWAGRDYGRGSHYACGSSGIPGWWFLRRHLGGKLGPTDGWLRAIARLQGRPTMVNIQALIDDAKCFGTVRAMRWPDGVRCTECGSVEVT